MPSAAIRSLRFAIESSYGQRDSSGRIGGGASSLTWHNARFIDVSQLDPVGDVACEPSPPGWGAGFTVRPVVPEQNELRAGTYRNSGSVTIDWLLCGGLAGASLPSVDVGLTSLLQLHFRLRRYSAAIATHPVSATGAITFSVAGSYRNFLAAQINGRVQYSIATSSTSLPGLAPYYPGTAGNYPTLGQGGTTTTYSNLFYLQSTIGEPQIGTSLVTRRTAALRIQGGGWQQTLFGCVMRSLRISPDGEGGAVRLSGTFDAAWVENANTAYTPVPFAPTYCRPLFARGARCGLQVNAGYSLAAEPEIYNWSVQIDWSLSRSGVGGFDTDAAAPEATACTVTADVWFHYNATLETWLQSQLSAGGTIDLCIPFGGDLTATIPYGGAIIMQACALLDAQVIAPDLSNGGRLIHARFAASLASSGSAYFSSFAIGFF